MIREAYKQYMESISSLIPEERIFTDPLRRLAHGTDGGFYRLEPQIVVRVMNEAEMQHCMSAAFSQKLPVTFKAAGTSLWPDDIGLDSASGQ